MTQEFEMCAPCGLEASPQTDRLSELRTALEAEGEPLVILTHLLRWCRDEHRVLWERSADPSSRERVAETLSSLSGLLPAAGTASVLELRARETS